MVTQWLRVLTVLAEHQHSILSTPCLACLVAHNTYNYSSRRTDTAFWPLPNMHIPNTDTHISMIQNKSHLKTMQCQDATAEAIAVWEEDREYCSIRLIIEGKVGTYKKEARLGQGVCLTFQKTISSSVLKLQWTKRRFAFIRIICILQDKVIGTKRLNVKRTN